MVNVAAFYETEEDEGRAARRGSPSSPQRSTRATPAAYVNFLGDEGEAGVRAAYPGETWDRLAAIKAGTTRTTCSGVNQNIPPAAG